MTPPTNVQSKKHSSIQVTSQPQQKIKVEPQNGSAQMGKDQHRLQILLMLEGQMRGQRRVPALSVWAVNEFRSIVDYSQCIFIRLNKNNKAQVNAVSSLSSVDRHAPFIRLVEKKVEEAIALYCLKKTDTVEILDVSLDQALDEHGQAATSKERVVYPFHKAIILPLLDFDGEMFGAFLFARRNQWSENELVVLKRLGESFSHAFQSLIPKRKLKPWGLSKWLGIGIGLCAVFAMFIPVPMSVMAPAEVVAAQPYIIAAPIDGVIRKIIPEANSSVQAGDVLFVLEDTVLKSDVDVARRKELVSQARYITTKQSAFSDPKAYKQLAIYKAEVALAKQQRMFAEAKLKRTIVRAQKDGLLIYSNRKDWVGKPVRTGEAIMEVADVDHVQLRVDLPVGDVIALHDSSRVRFFLDSNPLNPIKAKVLRASYRAKDVAGVGLVYQIVAGLDQGANQSNFSKVADDNEKPPRIGLRGTAQILGDKVFLGFYLFRKPISALRQYVGL